MRTITLITILLGITILLAGCSDPGEEAYNQGVKSLNAGKPAEARDMFLRALDENPNIAEAYLNLGRIDIKQGTYAEARKNTRKALEILEKSEQTIVGGTTWQEQAALACNNMASIAFQQALGQDHKIEYSGSTESERLVDEAKTWLAKAAELDPENDTIKKNRVFIQKWEKQELNRQ
ncbi:MAG: tetratricopeptide repeat protein [Desulfuromonadaceae bacterium]